MLKIMYCLCHRPVTRFLHVLKLKLMSCPELCPVFVCLISSSRKSLHHVQYWCTFRSVRLFVIERMDCWTSFLNTVVRQLSLKITTHHLEHVALLRLSFRNMWQCRKVPCTYDIDKIIFVKFNLVFTKIPFLIFVWN